jgi:hypothetical protein
MFVEIPALLLGAIGAVKPFAKDVEPVKDLFFGMPERAFSKGADRVAENLCHQDITAS